MKSSGHLSLKEEYSSRIGRFENLCDVAKFLLQQGINQQKIPIHSLESRVKSFASFEAKVSLKGASNPFEEIHDIVGLRVICFFRTDIYRISFLIKKIFNVIKEDDKATTCRPDEFNYLGTNLDVKLKGEFGGLGNYIFEIQLTTVAHNAWTSLSHYLDYKKNIDISNIVRRDLFALSGLFYVADTNIESLRGKYEEQIKPL